MQGTVRWYSHQGYGLLDPAKGGECYYFHIHQVHNQIVLRTGDRVTFDPTATPKGLRAVNVRKVSEVEVPSKTKEDQPCLQPTA
jgi:cold shock CspA family protein